MKTGLERLFAKPGPVAAPGLHHFRPSGAFEGRRVHLRIESDGTGVMVIDASKVIHLNRTACDFAFLMLSGAGRDEAVDRIRRRYRAGRAELEADWDRFRETVECLLRDDQVCPVTFLGLDRIEPFRTPVSAPYRADLAITYRCNVDCGHCYNEKRDTLELGSDGWREVINRLWDAGVPHVAFTGGEATLREDLPDLVAHAESVGMVSGLLTNGVRLADPAYLARLVEAGLDYVQITLESPEEAVHNAMTRADSFSATVQGLRNCISSGVYTITNTTITEANQGTLEELVDFAADLGLGSMAFNSVIRSGRAADGGFGIETGRLRLLLEKIRVKAAGRGVKLIWYSPTRYCELDPVDLQLGPKRCTAGQYNVCVEPDGSVIPCQSYYESAGNILQEPWERIYDCGLMRALREREWVDNDCRVCSRFDLCGGGCPLESRGGPVGCPDMLSNP